ncbi:integrase domain-containing protein [Moritella sp.]|uniref:integrase domain-containing protein n=1 Tax=Moritella sp. TaxID=78556 RepID=UPI001D80F3A0|nr:integrase domain-containing protein [Moritella sp.]MCJ8349175.1 integrase domain-containing protein [Moritella sp.]NQZ39463.1 tyrosine-type recombinase/integrase [Moritella sp.]
MAKKVTPLTNTQVKQAKACEKEFILADGDGLQLKIKPSGSKTWVFKYSKPFTKKRTNLGLGIYPEVSLAQARGKRKTYRELLAQDIDPKGYKDQEHLKEQEKHNNSLQVVAENWFGIKETAITTDYAKDIWRSLELHIFPTLGKYPVASLTAPVVIAVLKKVAETGNLETVRRLAQRLNEIMTFAVNTGLIHANPLSGIKSAFEKPKRAHMPTIKPEELPELMLTLNRANLHMITRALIEWQLHTMTRSNEAAKAEWSEIDVENKLWIIPASRMKMKREHTIPLTEQALAILTVLEPFKRPHYPYLFPSNRDPKKHINTETVNKVLRRIGYQNRLVAHGFRALASTTLNEKEFNPDVIEAALAHVDKNTVRKAYNRAEYLKHRIDLMCWWSDHIENSAKGSFSITAGIKLRKVI